MNEYLAAIRNRLMGTKPTDQEISGLSESMKLPGFAKPEDYLRKTAAKKLLESQTFSREGSPLGSRILRGAAAGFQSGLSLPSRGNSALAGVVGGLNALTSLQGQEEAMGKEKEGAATTALANLISTENEKKLLESKVEGQGAESISQLLAHSKTITPLTPDTEIPVNSIVQTINGQKYAFTPKDDLLSSIRFDALKQKELVDQITLLTKEQDNPKTRGDIEAQTLRMHTLQNLKEAARALGLPYPQTKIQPASPPTFLSEMGVTERDAPKTLLSEDQPPLSAAPRLPRPSMATPLPALPPPVEVDEVPGLNPKTMQSISPEELKAYKSVTDPIRASAIAELLNKKYGTK